MARQGRSRLSDYRTPLIDDYHAWPGPGLRRTAVATAAKQTACWMSRQIQVDSRGDCDGAATTSARQTSVAFAAERKQNAAQRSDCRRQPEPLHANTPVLRAHPSPPASWCGSQVYYHPRPGIQTMHGAA